MPDTTSDGAPYPLATEAIKDGAVAIQTLAQWVDDLFVQDLRDNRPSFGKPGRKFWATDSLSEWQDTGTAWRRLSVPAGSVIATGTPAAPEGYVAANGGTLPRTGATKDLWEAIGGLGGLGDGSTTFVVPDLRGRTMIGHGTGPGLTARSAGVPLGAETHQLGLTEIPSHVHTVTAFGTPDGVTTHGHTAGGIATSPTPVNTTPRTSDTSTSGGSGGVTAAHNNMQPSIGMYFYFKL